MFFEPFHGRLWAAIREVTEAGRRADGATMADKFAADPALIELGGLRYLADLIDHAPYRGHAKTLADSVVDGWVRRQGAELLHAGRADLLTRHNAPTAAILGGLRQSIDRLEQDSATGDSGLVDGSEACGDLLDALDDEAVSGRERGAMTGLRCIDRRLRGLRPGWLVTIGGRPSMAKSGLMRAAAYGCAVRNPEAVVLIFSLEMDRREIAERALSSATYAAGDGIAYCEFTAALAPYERQRLRGLRASMPRNVLIDDRSRVTVDDVRRRVWALKAKRPVAAVFIDYLQLMGRPAAAGRNETSVIGEMTTGLKQLAREAETCVVILSQLSRQVEGRDDKRPMLSDLRDSGSIEQDSNAVLFPFREAYYLERAEPKDVSSPEHKAWETSLELVRRRMDVIAAKVRGGAVGTDRQAYFAEFDHVEDVGSEFGGRQ